MIRNVSHHTKMIKGSEGRTPTAAAAYRAGVEIYSEKFGVNHDYTNKQDVLYSEINLPNNCPDKFLDRTILWNTIELCERQSNGQYAREITADFDRGLSSPQMIELAKRHVKEHFTSKGMIADWSIHQADASDGDKNPHLHIMLTLKEVKGDGFGRKNRAWNDKTLAEKWHKSWADKTNDYLELNESDRRVTNESFAKQKRVKKATIHLGVEANAMEQKGIKTDRGNINRMVRALNKELQSIKDQLNSYIGKSARFLLSIPSLVQLKRQEQQLALAGNHDIQIENANDYEQDIDPPDDGIDR